MKFKIKCNSDYLGDELLIRYPKLKSKVILEKDNKFYININSLEELIGLNKIVDCDLKIINSNKEDKYSNFYYEEQKYPIIEIMDDYIF